MQFRVLLFCDAYLQQAFCWYSDRLHDDQVDLQKWSRKWWYNWYRCKGVACYLSPSYFYTIGYRFALACYHGKCRKKVILEYFYQSMGAESNSDCCDVNISNIVDHCQGCERNSM